MIDTDGHDRPLPCPCCQQPDYSCKCAAALPAAQAPTAFAPGMPVDMTYTPPKLEWDETATPAPTEQAGIVPTSLGGRSTPEADKFIELMRTWRFSKVGREATKAFDAVAAYVNQLAARQAPIATPNVTNAWFHQQSSFGPWIECNPNAPGATAFYSGDPIVKGLCARPSPDGVDARDAARYRWLRDKSDPGICAFYLSVGKALDGVKFNQDTVDSVIDAQILALKETPHAK